MREEGFSRAGEAPELPEAQRGRSWRPRPPIRVGDAPSAMRLGLHQLALLRNVAIVGQALAIVASTSLGVALPLAPMAAIMVGLIAWNGAIFRRLRAARNVAPSEVVLSLAIDFGAIVALLYLSGGGENPFVLVLTLHAVMMALLLPTGAAAVGATTVVAAYALLMHVHLPLAMAEGLPLPPSLHAFGDATSFALTVGITAWFVATTVSALRTQERLLADAMRRSLRDDAVLRVGALAAGAAHELATPLTTAAVATGEILRHSDDGAVRRDAQIVATQLAVCRETVATLVAAGGHAQAFSGARARLDEMLAQVATRCRVLHPEATISSDWLGALPAPEISADQSLRQALQALVDNAVDASPEQVQIDGERVGDTLRISVADRGAGIAGEQRERLGHTFFTTKAPGKGAGLGVVLAMRTVEQFGGRLRWLNREGGGLVAEVELPLAALAPQELA